MGGPLNAPPNRAEGRECPDAMRMGKGRASEQFTARQVKQGRTAPGLGDGRMGNLSGVELQPERTPRPVSLRLLPGGRRIGRALAPNEALPRAARPILLTLVWDSAHSPSSY